MTNGYIVLTKGEPNLYKHAVEAITLGKPIYYADGNKVAFVNSIELVSTDVVIKTSDKQITVASDGTETEEDTGLFIYLINGETSGNVAGTIRVITSINADDIDTLIAKIDKVSIDGGLVKSDNVSYLIDRIEVSGNEIDCISIYDNGVDESYTIASLSMTKARL